MSNYTKQDYDGSLIHKRFGYEIFRKSYNPLGVILAIRGKMDVKENLIDLEDKLSDDFIYSEDALSFVWEIPNMNPIGAVFFQRLFVRELTDYITNKFPHLKARIKGDDIMLHTNLVNEGKASVSITKVTDTVALGHLGLNIYAGPRAPSFAFSLGICETDVQELAQAGKDIFDNILSDCFVATTKVF